MRKNLTRSCDINRHMYLETLANITLPPFTSVWNPTDMQGNALLRSCLFSLYFRIADESGVLQLRGRKMIPLHWSDLIQVTWEQCRQRQGERGGGACRKVLNRHQRLDMPFFTTNEYFAAPASVSSASHETYVPFSTNKLSISKAFPVKMKDAARIHLQGLWFLFACQT